MEKDTKRLKATMATKVVAEHRKIMKRAGYAGSTPDMDTSGSNTTVMTHTTDSYAIREEDRPGILLGAKRGHNATPLDKDEGPVAPGKSDGAGVGG